MAYTGFNFRSTLGGGTSFPGDAGTDVWAGLTNSSYLAVGSGGTGYGWTGTAPSGGNSANLNSPADARLGGVSSLSSSNNFRVDVPNGTYDVRIGVIRNSGTAARTGLKLTVGAGGVTNTDIFQIDSGSANVDNANALDASNNVFAKASWAASNVVKRVVVTQGFFLLGLGSAANPGGISHFAYQEVVVPLADGVLTDKSHITGHTPSLMESQPSGKILGYLDFSVGSSTDIDYTITQADGVTPDPYLTLTQAGSSWVIKYNGTRHPGTGPTRTFYVVQTDKTPGKHANSPYQQTFTLNVLAAPTKPYNDGSRLARYSTDIFLRRLKVTSAFIVPYLTAGGFGEWPGYSGQAFTQSITVYNWTQFMSAMGTLKAQAGANKWFSIDLDIDGTSDWLTSTMAGSSGNPNGDWDFKPELGGGLIIRNRPGGTAPIIRGCIYPRCMRGVHIDGLILPTDGSISVTYCIRFDNGVSAGGAISLVKITNCKFGCMFDPANSAIDRTTLVASKCPAAIFLNGTAEQVIIGNNFFWGTGDCIMTRARLIHTYGNDFAYGLGDNYAGTVPTNGDATYHPDTNQYEWHHDNISRAVGNVNNAIHSDFYQQRTSITPSFTSYKWFEDNFVHKGWTAAAFSAQLTQNSDTATIASGWGCNIFSTVGPRGIDICAVGAQTGYSEYNSFGLPAEMIPNNTQYAQQGVLNGGTAGTSAPMSRKNILTGNATANVSFEDDVVYNGKSPGTDPNTVMPGPFILDPSWTAAGGGIDRYISNISDDPKTVTQAQFRAAMIAAFSGKAGVDAGYITDPVVGVSGKASTARLAIGLGIRL